MSIRYETRNHRIGCWRSCKVSAGAHLHSDIEILYVADGKSTAWVDDAEYTITKGDVFVTFPNQVHRYESTDYEDIWVLQCSKDFCPEFNYWVKNYVPQSNVLHFDKYDTEKIEDLIAKIHKLYLKKNNLTEFEIIELKGLMLSFLSVIFAGLDFIEEKMVEVSVIKQMLGFCAANYTKELSLELLEKELHINRFYISHLFSKKLKIKFNDYVNTLRISHATKLLLETDMNMTDIISDSGFSTARTFNRVFLKMMGETPSQYRKRIRNL